MTTSIDQATPGLVCEESATFDRSVIDYVQRASATGLYEIRGLGAKRRVPHFDDLVFLGASLSRYPLEGYREKCSTKTLLGTRFATKPIELAIPITIAGMSSSPIVYGDTVIAIHDKENIDDSRIGRMVAVRTDAEPEPGKGPVVLDRAAERWRNDLSSFTSSPVLVGNRIYETVQTGELCCVDADSGKVLWQHRLAPDQIHASPVWADGRLFVPMNNGSFWVIRPTDADLMSEPLGARFVVGLPV